MWQPPSIRITWGEYFAQDPTEKKSTIDFAQAALGKGPGLVGATPLITRRQAVELIAPVIGIENVDAAMQALEDEAKADAAAALQRMQDSQKAMAATAEPARTEPADSTEPGAKPEPKSAPPAAPPKK